MGEGIFTEVKWENQIDRLTSQANPRPMERVPAGSEFFVKMLYDVYEVEGIDLQPDDVGMLRKVFEAMALLEDSALGGSGTRGYGRVKFDKVKVEWRPVRFYKGEEETREVDLGGRRTPAEIVKEFDQIQWPR